ncbi:hypothetical protein BN8_03635 [Fibrisoma limi BUZ 3]|uniref:Uncharacterized protein n=1 Tax=Fibrisoma limi BUZ 3 TaxID=1185876 RepID=I2GKN7_9BACT|nr:hypothetical protein [Fibrisoma limi]CCH54463.1 hypothetical protein BN8_03635 [Fibrisoma limi BUZ 3]
MKTGIELIAKEREEHTTKHEWTPEHDDQQDQSQLATAAVAVLLMDTHVDIWVGSGETAFSVWPWKEIDPWFINIQKKSRIDQLAVAGSLIAAEIDRLQRLSAKEATSAA